MAFPKIGNLAPAFTLPDQDGNKVSLKQFRDNKNVVLYFYPKAMTPGCTVQACGLRDSSKALAKKDTVVLGVSPDPVARLGKFIDKEQLNFTLLSDEDHAVAEKYGAWGEKNMYGKKTVGVIRSTVIVGKDGKVAKHWKKVAKAETHPEKVLEVLKTLP